MRSRIPIVVITGPTASGKSKLSMELARRCPTEIISADSMQVYKYMDIGTDKPSLQDREEVPHHLVDIKEPDEDWSVEEFQRLAEKAAKDIWARGRTPCIVGGTGLYVRAFLKGYPLGDAPPDLSFRRTMRERAKEEGNEALHALLKAKDPGSYRSLHPNDLRRVIRALEYLHITGEPISLRKDRGESTDYAPIILGLDHPREYLYGRIDARVDEQFREGIVQEVEGLFAKGYSHKLRSMQGLVYKEVSAYLLGQATLDETVSLVKRNTRRFAKRQFTWFRKGEGIIWIRAGNDRLWQDVVGDALKAVRNHKQRVNASKRGENQ